MILTKFTGKSITNTILYHTKPEGWTEIDSFEEPDMKGCQRVQIESDFTMKRMRLL